MISPGLDRFFNLLPAEAPFEPLTRAVNGVAVLAACDGLRDGGHLLTE